MHAPASPPGPPPAASHGRPSRPAGREIRAGLFFFLALARSSAASRRRDAGRGQAPHRRVRQVPPPAAGRPRPLREPAAAPSRSRAVLRMCPARRPRRALAGSGFGMRFAFSQDPHSFAAASSSRRIIFAADFVAVLSRPAFIAPRAAGRPARRAAPLPRPMPGLGRIPRGIIGPRGSSRRRGDPPFGPAAADPNTRPYRSCAMAPGPRPKPAPGTRWIGGWAEGRLHGGHAPARAAVVLDAGVEAQQGPGHGRRAEDCKVGARPHAPQPAERVHGPRPPRTPKNLAGAVPCALASPLPPRLGRPGWPARRAILAGRRDPLVGRHPCGGFAPPARRNRGRRRCASNRRGGGMGEVSVYAVPRGGRPRPPASAGAAASPPRGGRYRPRAHRPPSM